MNIRHLPQQQKKQAKVLLEKSYDVKSLKQLSLEIGEHLSKEFIKRLTRNIKTNKFGYDLSESSIKKRLAAGVTHDDPFLFKEQLIKSVYSKKGKVLVKKGKHYSGLTYQELWFILEHGRRDKHIPARPVWSETYKQFRKYAERYNKKKLQEFFAWQPR